MLETSLTTSAATLCQIMTIVPMLLFVLTVIYLIFSMIVACRETIAAIISSTRRPKADEPRHEAMECP